jgi:hypothetical protein
VKPSAEIKEAMLRVYAAHASEDASAMLPHFSRQIVQHHVSIGVLNTEVFGKELTI